MDHGLKKIIIICYIKVTKNILYLEFEYKDSKYIHMFTKRLVTTFVVLYIYNFLNTYKHIVEYDLKCSFKVTWLIKVSARAPALCPCVREMTSSGSVNITRKKYDMYFNKIGQRRVK